MQIDLSGKRILITGAAVRIGRAIALACAESGARVAVHYHRSGAAAAELVARLNSMSGGHRSIQADLCDRDARRRLIPALLEDGPLHGLVNNASVYRRSPLEEVDEERLRQEYEVNFVAPFMLMREFAARCGRGSIVNLLDERVARVDPGSGAYGLAKKTLRDVTEAAAVEWAPAIRVNGVAPGITLPPPGVSEDKMVPLLRNVPMRRTSPPEEVARACVFLLALETVTGQILHVDGGMHLVGTACPERPRADYGGR